MRLLNVHSLTFSVFHHPGVPPYAIASHRWKPGTEVSLGDIEKKRSTNKDGYKKVEDFCAFVRDHLDGVDWVWIDTCCVNQKSSAEVQEAISSMFQWYYDAVVCLAYLADVASPSVEENHHGLEGLEQSVWFTRGWTLQELLAPHTVVFLTQNWGVVGHKSDLKRGDRGLSLDMGPQVNQTLARITKIPEECLTSYELSKELKIENRLAWMARRTTERKEDMTYCLLGIFEVRMRLDYGEGEEEARRRLLEAIEQKGRKRKIRKSIPSATVSTYTERQELSEDLVQKLSKPNASNRLAHAVTVTGLAGTGKTQLVLNYVEMHGETYDTVLWLDARSEETLRSSFERCCYALDLSTKPSPGQTLLRDTPSVQAMLDWLRGRLPEQKWLVVVDNADDLSLELSSIIPSGKAGSLIVTSTDSYATELLGPGSQTVKVDAMETSEAVALLLKVVTENSEEEKAKLAPLAKEMVTLLDMVALAVDLAVAYIRVEIAGGMAAEAALRQYLSDFQQQRDILLRRSDFTGLNSYRKTMWTVWETTLSSLKKIDETQGGTYSFHLLILLANLDGTNVQRELFRLASLGLQIMEEDLNLKLPSWLQKVLSTEADQWNDFYYRSSVKPLLRYGLVRSVDGLWSGLTMHSLVRWRANQEGGEEYGQWYVAFIVAACLQNSDEEDAVRFRRHMIVHLPTTAKLLEGRYGGWGDGIDSWICMELGNICIDDGNWKDAEHLYFAASQKRLQLFGPNHSKTLASLHNLATTYMLQSRESDAEKLMLRVTNGRTKALGREHPDTLASINNLASIYWEQGRWKEAEKLDLRVVESRKRVLGVQHLSTLGSMSSLAATYRNQGRLREAEELGVQVMEMTKEVLGEKHPETLSSMQDLAETYWNQGRIKEAEELQARLKEAEELEVQVIEWIEWM